MRPVTPDLAPPCSPCGYATEVHLRSAGAKAAAVYHQAADVVPRSLAMLTTNNIAVPPALLLADLDWDMLERSPMTSMAENLSYVQQRGAQRCSVQCGTYVLGLMCVFGAGALRVHVRKFICGYIYVKVCVCVQGKTSRLPPRVAGPCWIAAFVHADSDIAIYCACLRVPNNRKRLDRGARAGWCKTCAPLRGDWRAGPSVG